MRRPFPPIAAVCVAALLLVIGLTVANCSTSATTTSGQVTTTAVKATTTAAEATTTTVKATTTTAKATTTTAKATTTTAGISGAALYASNCLGCHSDGVSGSASAIASTIKSGAGGAMPSFSDKLSAAQIDALAAYAAGGGH
jgi:mono/diheme cytochrome c family protein